MSRQADWPSRSRRISWAYHRMLSALSASIETTARIGPDPWAWGHDSSLTLINPCTSGASRLVASSAQFTSGDPWAMTIEHDTTPAMPRTVATPPAACSPRVPATLGERRRGPGVSEALRPLDLLVHAVDDPDPGLVVRHRHGHHEGLLAVDAHGLAEHQGRPSVPQPPGVSPGGLTDRQHAEDVVDGPRHRD